MKIIKLILAISIFSSISCSKNIMNDKLVGTWVYSNYENETFEYIKASKFIEDLQGIKFKKNGEIIKHQNAGWCGTPPIYYENSSGSWEMISNNNIYITYDYWGGTGNENWKIISLTDQKIEFKISI